MVVAVIHRDKAKATAAALLEDESFIVKYPALARALRESVESVAADCASEICSRAAPQSATRQQEAASISPPTTEKQHGASLLGGTFPDSAATASCTTADRKVPASSDTGTTQLPVEAHQLSMKSPSTSLTPNGASSVEQHAVPHSTAQPKQEPTAHSTHEMPCTNGMPQDVAGEKAAAVTGNAASSTSGVERAMDPPLHYMKR